MGDPASPTTNRGAGGYSLVEITSTDLTAPIEYRVAGYSQVSKTATATGTTARIYVPKSWAGKRVAVILLAPPDDPILHGKNLTHYILRFPGNLPT